MTPDLEQRPSAPRTPRPSTSCLPVAAADAEPNAAGGVETSAIHVPAHARSRKNAAPRSDAASIHSQSTRDSASPAARLRFPLFIALLAGGAIAAFWPISYSNTCAFQVTAGDEFDVPQVRSVLLDYLWAQATPRSDWSVFSPREGRLNLILRASGSAKTHEAGRLARSFIDHMQTLVTQSAPSESETYLERLLAEAQSSFQETTRSIDGFPPENGADPRARRDNSIEHRNHLAERYTQASAAWIQAQQRLDALTQSGAPVVGTVDEELRTAAQQEDQALQQDLRELTVRLTELRAELAAATKQASEKLPALENAILALLALLQEPEPAANLVITASVSGLLQHATEYRSRFDSFADQFSAAATRIEATEPDPIRDDLLNAYSSLRKLSGDFLFDASKLLTAMRKQVDSLSEGDAAAPRNYQSISDLTRAFGQVQTAHHRFEFAAAKVDSANNFRLDSALRSSRGLRSRTRDRLTAIEDDLQAKALQSARNQYARDLTDAQTEHARARADLDAAVGELVQADDTVLASVGASDEFLEVLIRRELAQAAADDHARQIAELQQFLDRRAARREALTAEPPVSLVGIETSLDPQDLPQRLTLSGAAFAVAFISLLLGQWRLIRPNR